VSYPDITPIAPFADLTDLGPRSRRLRVFSYPRYYRAGERWGITVEAFTRAESPWVARAAEGVHALAVRDDGLCVCDHAGHRLTFRLTGLVALDAAGTPSLLSGLADLSDRAAWRLDASLMDQGIIAWEDGSGARYEVRYGADGVTDRFVLSDSFRSAVRAKLPAGASRFGLAFDCGMPPGLARRVAGREESDHDTELPIELAAPGIRQRLSPSVLRAPTLPLSHDLTDPGWRERWRFSDGRLLQTLPLEALGTVGELRTSVTYQQGTDGYSGCTDARLVSGDDANKNWGASIYHTVGRWSSGNIERSPLRFDISGIPAGSTINSATAYAYCVGIWNNGGDAVSAYMILKDWGEGNNDGVQADAGECCWNYAKYTSSAWTGCANNGTDAEAGAQDSATVSATSTWYDWDVSNAVADWQGGTANYGLVFKGNEANDQHKQGFASKEDGTTSHRPKLTIDYTAGAAETLDGAGLARGMPGAMPRRMN